MNAQIIADWTVVSFLLENACHRDPCPAWEHCSHKRLIVTAFRSGVTREQVDEYRRINEASFDSARISAVGICGLAQWTNTFCFPVIRDGETEDGMMQALTGLLTAPLRRMENAPTVSEAA